MGWSPSGINLRVPPLKHFATLVTFTRLDTLLGLLLPSQRAGALGGEWPRQLEREGIPNQNTAPATGQPWEVDLKEVTPGE